ncbi:DoxX family membrane protein [Mariniflexile gromovii]|uniref:DoxX family membrane protein n=1 Tax=Mariniflexile gromovii TaxID=362523 RepID=A0ABS4BWR3_9FLAO|nr:DoxX family membrane protein [Mariniflexile gromovii]MBP0905033.1 DoxX family membrane protein [Mariniflexile gromovii]
MKNKIIFVVSLLFGLMFINAGLNKFFNYMPMPDDIPKNMVKLMTAFMEIVWLMPLVGFAEFLGGLLFAIPKTRAHGAIVIFPVMIGILLTNIISAPSGLPIVLVLLAINLWIIYENKEKYFVLIK